MLKTPDPALAHEPKLLPFDWSDPFGLDEQLRLMARDGKASEVDGWFSEIGKFMTDVG